MERTQKNMPSKKLLAIWAHHIARVNSKRITKYLAYHYSKEFKFVFVGGYPKSGTTWVSQQVAAYLDLPFLRHSPPVPQAFPAVIHHHWDYHPSSDHSIYVTRDGRDAMVSSYMSVMKNFEITSAKFASVSKWHPVRNLTYFTGQYADTFRRIKHLYGNKFDLWDIKENLPKFIEMEMKRPLRWAVKKPWPEHIMGWRGNAKETAFVKYEDMLADPVATLSKTLRDFLQKPIDQDEIIRAVDRYSFKRMTGRKPGIEDRKSFVRKGVAGDWQNSFSPEARQVFDYYAGDVLIDVGYEPDHQWVKQTN